MSAEIIVHNNHLDAPIALTDSTGKIVWSANYDPFGAAVVRNDVDGDGNQVTLNVRNAGQYFDQETGLHANGFRDYDPSTGRYIEADPIGVTKDYSAPEINPFGSRRSAFDYALNHNYAYADGNPVNNFDFSGLYVNGFQRFDVRALITNPNSMGLIPNPNPNTGGSSSSCPTVLADMQTDDAERCNAHLCDDSTCARYRHPDDCPVTPTNPPNNCPIPMIDWRNGRFCYIPGVPAQCKRDAYPDC